MDTLLTSFENKATLKTCREKAFGYVFTLSYITGNRYNRSATQRVNRAQRSSK